METPRETPPKKPYQKPELTAYGDIREITQTVAASTGNPDGQVIFGMQRKTGGGL